eukprot:scaffold1180_cov321-Prasinococcus_capsulatus_cf.AAC.8
MHAGVGAPSAAHALRRDARGSGECWGRSLRAPAQAVPFAPTAWLAQARARLDASPWLLSRRNLLLTARCVVLHQQGTTEHARGMAHVAGDESAAASSRSKQTSRDSGAGSSGSAAAGTSAPRSALRRGFFN